MFKWLCAISRQRNICRDMTFVAKKTWKFVAAAHQQRFVIILHQFTTTHSWASQSSFTAHASLHTTKILPCGACFLNCSSKIIVDDITSFICAQ